MKAMTLKIVFLLTLIHFTLTGCATNIPLLVQRTPSMDTSGIRRIAIMPFETAAVDAIYQNAARHAANTATSRIQATNHFTLVSPSTVNDARSRGENIENFVDALFTGQIIRITENTASKQGQRRNKEGETETYTYYTREVNVNFSYHFIRTRDGTMIGPVTKSGSNSITNENYSALESVESLINRIIDNQLRNLNRDVAPYSIMVNRPLEKEKNKDLKLPMEEALALVKGSNYTAARQAYINIWQSYQSVAAAVNASILYEAVGETRNAAIFMQQVYNSTGSPIARSALSRLNLELAQQAGVQQYGDTRSPAEKAANYASAEVQKKLPAKAKVWIHNNAADNQNLVNDVIDNMTVTFLGSGISVIERQMIDIILKEQNFQLSGYVSDDDFVSIGNMAGANTVVVIGITGAGASRRLQVRVLDIQTAVVIMQSGTGSEWNL